MCIHKHKYMYTCCYCHTGEAKTVKNKGKKTKKNGNFEYSVHFMAQVELKVSPQELLFYTTYACVNVRIQVCMCGGHLRVRVQKTYLILPNRVDLFVCLSVFLLFFVLF